MQLAPLALIFLLIIVVFVLFVWLIPVRLWIAAWSSGARVGFGELIGMRLRRVSPGAVVNPRIAAVKAGLQAETNILESHYLAGGNVDITTPKITAVAKDGIQLLVVTRITVRSNIDRLVGGATEETVVARVGEGIVSTIGSAGTYAEVLENPDSISKNVLSRGLDSGTAFNILSIDIADVDVGTNIGAKLMTEQAEADKQVAQARAEGRRALAVAAEQEMRAKVEEMRAHLVEAEAKIPAAMAEALKEGNLGVMDYYNLRNVAADTEMRDSISKATGGPDDDSEV
jgi:uncharacterized protein YqfA (UPF0365 family)